MANDEKTASQLVSTARAAQDLREHLASLPPNQLVELCLHVVNTYVLEGVTSLTRAGTGPTTLAEDTHGEETFAGLLRRLKTERRDPILDKFVVEGENISVRIGNELLPLTEYRRSAGAAQPGAPPVQRGVTANLRPMQPGAGRPGVATESAAPGGRDPFGGAPQRPGQPEPARRGGGAQEPQKQKGDVPPPGGPRLIEMD